MDWNTALKMVCKKANELNIDIYRKAERKMNVPFSPPDITELEIEEVASALRSGWITTGPKTKELERLVAACCGTEKAV